MTSHWEFGPGCFFPEPRLMYLGIKLIIHNHFCKPTALNTSARQGFRIRAEPVYFRISLIP